MSQQTGIQIINIEKELARLHYSQNSSTQNTVGLFNLVVFSNDPSRHAYLQNIVQAIVKKFPSRIIFIQTKEDKGDYLNVSVSNKIETEGQESIACDRILIEVSKSQFSRIPFLVIPHFVPDLPIYLLWGQNPLNDDLILPHLLPFSSRIIFDSDCSEDLHSFSQKILRFMEKWPAIDLIDLNWVRIFGWREVLNKVFNSPTALDRLRHTKNIQVFYNSKPAEYTKRQPIQAIFLAAWLISQLNWKWLSSNCEDSLIKITCNNGTQDFSITLSPETHEALNPGSIAQIELASSDDHFYFISPMEKLPKAVVHISSLEACELPFTLPLYGIKKGIHFSTELIFSPTSTHYKNILNLLQNTNKCPM